MKNTPVSHLELVQSTAYINGRWVEAKPTAERFTVTNPATGEAIAEIYDATETDANTAIAAAKAALPAWSARTAKDRSAILKRWHALILQHQDALAEILTREQGKPLAEARGEIAYGAAFIEWFAEEAKRVYGDLIPAHGADKRLMVMKQPIGVVAAITPWNFPNAMLTRKLAPALAAGCTVVAKPAEDTPLSALALAVLAEEAGIPAGVLNILPTTRAAEIGTILCEHPDIAKLSFTGSTEVGKILMSQCAGTVKKLSLELGGNAPFIVFDDADLDAAVKGLMTAKFRNAGQTCVSANRVFVHASVRDVFLAKLQTEVAALHVGDGMKNTTTLGPLINRDATHKVARLVDDALRNGAEFAGDDGFVCEDLFTYPLILTGAHDDMAMAREEIFGPVIALYSFESEAEVVARANASRHGLAAYFYTRDIGRVFRVAEALEYGMLGINEGLISTETAPFGGMKESGFGREGSKYGMDDYLALKYLCIGGI